MTVTAGVRSFTALDWQSTAGAAPYPQFFSRLSAFITAVNATPGNEDWQLAVLKRHTDATDTHRGMVLRLGTPQQAWVLLWVHTPDLFTPALLRVSLLKNWLDDGSNGGYGQLLHLSEADPAIDLTAGSSSAALIPHPMSPAALIWAQDMAPGREWFLFKADCTTNPADDLGDGAGGRPFCFLLYRQSNHPAWSVVFPTTRGIGCQLHRHNGYERITETTSSLAQLQTFAARHFAYYARSRTASGFTSQELEPSQLPPAIWIGQPYPYLPSEPSLLTMLFRRITTPDLILFQVGRALFQHIWLAFDPANLPPAITGWTSFAAWSGWLEGAQDLTLIDNLPSFTASARLPDNQTTRAPFVSTVATLRNPLLRQAFIAALQLQGGSAPMSRRPAAGLLWPRRTAK